MNTEYIEFILEQHDIHPKFWPEFVQLILNDTPPGPELKMRLNTASNYQEALQKLRHTRLDFLGQEIKAGSTILYPVRRGSEMWLNKLNVTHVDTEGLKGLNHLGRRIVITNLKNVVVIDKLVK